MHDAVPSHGPVVDSPPPPRPPAGSGKQERGRVHAAVVGEYLRVRFGPGFDAGDLEIVKRIRGRRWEPDSRTWRLPSSEAVLEDLRREFGGRLLEEGTGDASAAGDTADAGESAKGVGVVGGAAESGAREGGAAEARAAEGAAGSGAAGSGAAGSGAAGTGAAGTGAVGSATSALVAEVRRVVRLREYSRKTEKAYVSWVERYFRWASAAEGAAGATGTAQGAAQGTARGAAQGAALDEAALVAFLEHLGHEGLAARSRNQAASALNFLLREVLRRDDVALPRARGPVRMPVVLTHREVMRLLGELKGKYRLVGMLLYSSGLRIGECLSLRLKDLDFELRQILVRDGKGRKDRYVPLAARAVSPLRAQVRRVHEQQRRDLVGGHGWAPLPGALHRKDPGAGYQPGWQFLFPARTINADPATGHTGRWSLHVTAAERAFKTAVRQSGIAKRASCHTLRHSFATETLRGGCDIRTLQQVMGHRDIRTTTIYLHVVQQTGLHIRSPLDRHDDYDDFSDDILPALLPEEESDRQGQRGRPEGSPERRRPRPRSEPRA
jgi:integron integrase